VITKTVWIDEKEEHPGGIQVMGNILAVGAGDEVHFYDLADPPNPVHLGPDDPDAHDGVGFTIYREGLSGSSTSMAKLADGRYMLVVSNTDADPLTFYISNQPDDLDLSEGFSIFEVWKGDELDDHDWSAYQSINLVTDCHQGELYLIGTHNTGKIFFGKDFADLFRVDYKEDTNDIEITKESKLHTYCDYRGKKHCNFDAAGGVYVDPSGRMLLYAAEHASDGPDNSVKFMEFRQVPHESCSSNIENSWIELYDDDHWEDRSLMIDYIDRELENYTDYSKVDDFDEKISSARWCLPDNWVYYLFSGPKAQGQLLPLYGNGDMREIDDMKKHAFGDKTWSSYFIEDPPAFGWVNPNNGINLIYIRQFIIPETDDGSQIADDVPSTTIDVPAGAVEQETKLTYVPVFPPAHDTDPYISPGYAFNLVAEVDEVLQPELAFLQPARVTIKYTEDMLQDIYPHSLFIGVWGDGADAWVDAASTCNPTSTTVHNQEENWIETDICRTGEFALLGKRSYKVNAPMVLDKSGPIIKNVLFDEAHDEINTLDWGRAQDIVSGWGGEPESVYFGLLKSTLSDEFTLVRNASSPLTGSLLEEYDALMLSVPTYKLTSSEVQAVRDFVAWGGGLILLGDAYYLPPNTELSSHYNIYFQEPGIFSPIPEFDSNPVITSFVDHEAVEGLTIWRTAWGQSLMYTWPAIELALTDSDTWQDSNLNQVYDSGEDLTGIFTVIAGNDTGCGRVIVLSDNNFSDGGFDYNNSEPVMRALLRWVTRGNNCN